MAHVVVYTNLLVFKALISTNWLKVETQELQCSYSHLRPHRPPYSGIIWPAVACHCVSLRPQRKHHLAFKCFNACIALACTGAPPPFWFREQWWLYQLQLAVLMYISILLILLSFGLEPLLAWTVVAGGGQDSCHLLPQRQTGLSVWCRCFNTWTSWTFTRDLCTAIVTPRYSLLSWHDTNCSVQTFLETNNKQKGYL